MKSLLAISLLGFPLAVGAQVPSDTVNPAVSSSTGIATGTVQGSANRVTPSTPNGYVTMGDKTYVLKDGRVFQLTEAITLQIRPDGRVIGFEGEEMSIPAGLMLTTDGRLVQAPDLGVEPNGSTYQINRGTASNSSPSNSPMGAGMSGESPNSAGLDSENDGNNTGSIVQDSNEGTTIVDDGANGLNRNGINSASNGEFNDVNQIDRLNNSNNRLDDSNMQMENSGNQNLTSGQTGQETYSQPAGNANSNGQGNQGTNDSSSMSNNDSGSQPGNSSGDGTQNSNGNASDTDGGNSTGSNGSSSGGNGSGMSSGSSGGNASDSASGGGAR